MTAIRPFPAKARVDLPPVRPAMIEQEDQLIGLLRGRREAIGWSQAQLDERIGWSDAYTSKVEAPYREYGRRVAWGLMSTLFQWCQALGLAIVLMDSREAEALIAASQAPDMAQARPLAYPGRERDGGAVAERRIRLGYVFRSAA